MMDGSSNSSDSFTPPFDNDDSDLVVVPEEGRYDTVVTAATTTGQAASMMTTKPPGYSKNADPPLSRSLPSDFASLFYHSMHRSTSKGTEPKQAPLVSEHHEEKASSCSSPEPTAAVDNASPPPTDVLEQPATVPIAEVQPAPTQEGVKHPASMPIVEVQLATQGVVSSLDDDDGGDLSTVGSQTIVPSDEETIGRRRSPILSESILSFKADDATVSDELLQAMENEGEESILPRNDGTPLRHGSSKDSKKEIPIEENQRTPGEPSRSQSGKFDLDTFVSVTETLLQPKEPQTDSFKFSMVALPIRRILTGVAILVAVLMMVGGLRSLPNVKSGNKPPPVQENEVVEEDHFIFESLVANEDLIDVFSSTAGSDSDPHDDDIVVDADDAEVGFMPNTSSCDASNDSPTSIPPQMFTQDPSEAWNQQNITQHMAVVETISAHSKCHSSFGWNYPLEFLVTLPPFCQTLFGLVFLSAAVLACTIYCIRERPQDVKEEDASEEAAGPAVKKIPVLAIEPQGAGPLNQIDLKNYNKLRIVDLKPILRGRHCRVGGKKRELIDRLVKHYQEELEAKTHRDLQAILKDKGLKQNGKRNDLIIRLLEAGF